MNLKLVRHTVYAKILKSIFDRSFFALIILFVLSGCVGKVDVTLPSKKIKPKAGFTVSNIQVVNNQVVITGTNLNEVEDFQIKDGPTVSGLVIESKTSTSIIANTVSNVTFAAGKMLDFIFSSAEAASTFSVNFSLCDSTLGGKGFSCLITPNDKEVLSYDAASGTWKPRAVNGLSYLGAWDASSGVVPGARPSGSYYIVGVVGNIGGSYNVDVGDWIVSNGTAWQKIDNSTVIVDVFGRTGAIVPMKGDYDLNKLADVDLTAGATLNQVLKYDGSKWVAGSIVTVETDPSVSAFAKAALPNCAAGEVLRSNGTSLSCVTDQSGASSFTGTANRAVVTDSSGNLTVSAITDVVLGYLSGVTSNVQTQIDNKMDSSSFVDWSSFGVAPVIHPSRINLITNDRVVVTNGSANVAASSVTTTELGYLTGVTSSIQTQLNSKLSSYTETDPGVMGFAKTALPVCGTGEVLKSNGTAFSCVADTAGDDEYTGIQNRLVLTDGATGALTTSTVTNVEAGYLSGVTSAIQTQLNSKQSVIDRTTVQPVRSLRVYGTNTTNYVELTAPALAGNTSYVLPAADGTNGQVLKTNGAGILGWSDDDSGNASFTGTANKVVVTNGSGALSTVTTSDTEVGYLAGVTSAIQTQLNGKQASGNYVTALTGDVTAAGPGSAAATVVQVGGVTAANVAAGATLANASTNLNTASTIIRRDASGNFTAGTITATLDGNATNVTGVVAVANGGTGATTLAANRLLFGNGTSAVGALSVTGTPSVLLSTITSGAPVWTTSTTGNVLKGSATGVEFGALLLSDLPSAVLSGTGTVNTIPYFNATNTLATSPLTVSGSNVGIGKSGAGSALDVLGTLRLSGSTSGYVGFAPPAVAGSTTYTLPSADGTVGQLLRTSGTGVLSWVSASSGGAAGGDLSGTYPNPTISALDAAKISTGVVSNTEFNYLDGVTSSIQTQLSGKQASGNYVTALTGDVTAAGPGSAAAIVVQVGGVTAANVAAGAGLANAATALNTASTIVRRDASGNFTAGTITANLIGTATSAAPSGSAGGDLSGTYPNPTITALSAAKISTGVVSNTEFNYLDGVTSSIQTQLNGKQASGNYVTALTGDVTAAGPGSAAAIVAQVGGVTAANVAAGVNLANAATNLNTVSTIVRRDPSGNFDAGTVTVTSLGAGTATPRSAVDINGTLLVKPSTLNATGIINFALGNLQHTAANCGNFSLHHMKDGGSYTFAVKGATSATCVFSAYTDAGTTPITFHYPIGHGATVASKHTIYTFIVMGTDVYASWIPGL